MGEAGRKEMIELIVKIDAGTDKCMECSLLSKVISDGSNYCPLFDRDLELSPSGPYRLEECKKAEIKELR
jgi:hypothetical protein